MLKIFESQDEVNSGNLLRDLNKKNSLVRNEIWLCRHNLHAIYVYIFYQQGNHCMLCHVVNSIFTPIQ